MTTKTTLPVRRTDPDTSHEAAAKAIVHRPRIRDAILRLLDAAGEDGMTHDDMILSLNDLHRDHPQAWPPGSPSGVRTRTSELVTDGLVAAVPDHAGRSGMGNRARLWRAVNV